MPSLLLGSISTIADTSELQRSAFNRAFGEHGLDWHWDQASYRDLLTGNGGKQRISQYADHHGDSVDAGGVHATKSSLFQDALADGVTARAGVADTVRAAKAAGWQVALVTTTSGANLDALFAGLDGQLSREDFDLVVDADSVDDAKPDPAAYRYALDQLGEEAATAVAVEDNVGGVASAQAAGLTVLAFPNENTREHDFGDVRTVDRLEASAIGLTQ